jgi:hypothetical protein
MVIIAPSPHCCKYNRNGQFPNFQYEAGFLAGRVFSTLLRPKVNFCDGHHIPFAWSALSLCCEGLPSTEGGMRQILFVGFISIVSIALAADVVAAGVKTSVVKTQFHFAAPASGIGIALPNGMKSFPAELLPQ